VSEDRDALYERRRSDAMVDRRLDRLSVRIGDVEAKVDALARNVYIGMGVLIVVSALFSIVGPIIARDVLGP